MKTAILGVGNLLLSDEGLGVRAVEILRSFSFDGDVEILDGGTLGIDLLYFLDGCQRLLIVDAILGGQECGTLYRIEGDEVNAYFRQKVSAHELGIQEVLAFMDILGKKPPEICVMGIEPYRLEVSTELSPVVKEKLGTLIEMILDKLKEWGIHVSAQRSTEGG